MEPPACISVGRRGAGLHHRRLSGLRRDAAEHGQTRERASPVQAFRRDHDDRPADARAESGVRSDPRLLRQSRLGVRLVHDHPARGRGRVPRNVRLGWRPGHLVAFGPQGGHGRYPDDPARLDVPQSSGCLSRLLDLGLPGDRRLSETSGCRSGPRPIDVESEGGAHVSETTRFAKGWVMPKPTIVSREEWLEARRAHLAREKEFTRRRDQLSAERRAMPWVRVDKGYVFERPEGKATLADLFDGRRQLIAYHFMFGPGWEEGCPSCSFLADHIDGAAVHLAQRDVTLLAVSRAPLRQIEAFKAHGLALHVGVIVWDRLQRRLSRVVPERRDGEGRGVLQFRTARIPERGGPRD